jgi:hypothetical protein
MLATAGKMRVSCTLEKQHHAINIETRLHAINILQNIVTALQILNKM